MIYKNININNINKNPIILYPKDNIIPLGLLATLFITNVSNIRRRRN